MSPNEENLESSSVPQAVQESMGTKKEESPDSFYRGVILKVNFRSEESGFAVMLCETERDASKNNPDSVIPSSATVIGVIPESITVGCNVIARGIWVDHPRFGKQFKSRSITETRPTSREAICRYLGSGAIKGFGPVLAERLVEAFGEDTLKILDEDPDRLSEVSGIGAKKLEEIKEAWGDKSNLREVILFFQNYGISIALAQRIYKEYGDRSIELVKDNPYILAKEVWRIGFKTADRIAVSLGLSRDDPKRLAAGIKYCTRLASDEGNCFLPKEILLAKSSSLLEVANFEVLEDALNSSVSIGDLVDEESNIYVPAIHKAESLLAELISKRISPKAKPAKTISASLLEEFQERRMEIKIPGKASRIISLSPDQKKALELVRSNLLTVVTGGPGCGKTTVVRSIVNMLKRSSLVVSLAAPTGKAAQRLAEVCEMEASTIHRLLKFDPIQRSFVYDQKSKMAVDAVILDECSMIDINLAASVMQAIPGGARVIIVGDADQLPSVGPGRFLSDLLKVSNVPRVALHTLFRREEESSITAIAHSVNAADVPRIPEPDGETKSDSYFLKAQSPTKAAGLIERLVSEQILKRFGQELALRTDDIMVLTPMNKGDLGVIALNQRLQLAIVKPNKNDSRVHCGNLTFYLGDRVIQRVNNYNINNEEVYNGDQGTIIGIDREAGEVLVELWDGRKITYKGQVLQQLDLAYALTIHRSQGSEVPVVVLALHDTHNIMLERQLLYTAITRAKKLLILVGTRRALNLAVKRVRSQKRHSLLTERIETNGSVDNIELFTASNEQY